MINNIFKINDVSKKNNKSFVENQTIFNRLDDERNWISANFAKKLRSDLNEKINKLLGLKIYSNLNIRNQNNNIIVPKELKLKNNQKVIDKAITPNCILKWDTFDEKKFNWISIGIYLTRLNVYRAFSSSNGNVCITFYIPNIDCKQWENQIVNVIFVIMK